MPKYMSNTLLETLKTQGELIYEHFQIPSEDLYDWTSISGTAKEAFYAFIVDEIGYNVLSISKPEELTYGMLLEGDLPTEIVLYIEEYGITLDDLKLALEYLINCTYPEKYDGKITLYFLDGPEYSIPSDITKKDLGNGYITLYSPSHSFQPLQRNDNTFKITYTE